MWYVGGATNTYDWAGVVDADGPVKDQCELATRILHDHAELFSSLVKDCDPERLREPRHTRLQVGPTLIKLQGGSGGAGFFVGQFVNRTGAKARTDMVYVGGLTLRGKLMAVS